ncbi:MAG TPA: response regulator transcription factor [Gemmatimonadaceae bacterium]
MKAANKRQVRVLLVEQNTADAELVIRELRKGETAITVERVDAAEDFSASLTSFAPDVVLVEHLLPGLDFNATVETVQSVRPRTPIIVVSGPLQNSDAGRFIRAGAETFISKTNLGRLAPAVSEALKARTPLDKLTSRQIEVMKLVALGFRTRDIAERLHLSVKTVESHRQEVTRRLGLRNMADLVRFAVRVGLVASAQ